MQNDSAKVTELVESVRNIISKKPYATGYIKDLSYVFDRILRYCDQNSIEFYSAEIGDRFLYDECGIQPGLPSKKCTHVQRVVNMLTEYSRLGVVVPRRTKGRVFPENFAVYANSYLDKLKKDFKTTQSLLRMKTILLKFTEYLDQNDFQDFSQVSADDVNTYYSKCLNNYAKKYVHDNVNGVRRFLSYLYTAGMIDNDIAPLLMKVTCPSAPKHLPDTFTEEEIDRILAAVDRDSPIGKRDYAILLVAARLGLRQSDIKNLCFSNIDWEANEINLVQVKTKQPLTLPLPEDVGWAIIEYIKEARPKSDAKEIFLRYTAPYTPLDNYNWMLSKYMRLAGISLVGRYHHGFHTFRHSLATRLLEMEVPITSVMEILGHLIPETTKMYTQTDTAQRSECALEVPSL